MASNRPPFGIKTNALPPHRRYGAIQAEEVPKHTLWPKNEGGVFSFRLPLRAMLSWPFSLGLSLRW
jgi:hypothetical protein